MTIATDVDFMSALSANRLLGYDGLPFAMATKGLSIAEVVYSLEQEFAPQKITVKQGAELIQKSCTPRRGVALAGRIRPWTIQQPYAFRPPFQCTSEPAAHLVRLGEKKKGKTDNMRKQKVIL